MPKRIGWSLCLVFALAISLTMLPALGVGAQQGLRVAASVVPNLFPAGQPVSALLCFSSVTDFQQSLQDGDTFAFVFPTSIGTIRSLGIFRVASASLTASNFSAALTTSPDQRVVVTYQSNGTPHVLQYGDTVCLKVNCTAGSVGAGNIKLLTRFNILQNGAEPFTTVNVVAFPAGPPGPPGPQGGGLQGLRAFSVPGTSQFTVPAGVSVLSVDAWGAGGGGGNVCDPGGGGAYIRAFVPVTPSATYNVLIGQGGQASGSSGGDGGATKFGDTLIVAGGGKGGIDGAGIDAAGGTAMVDSTLQSTALLYNGVDALAGQPGTPAVPAPLLFVSQTKAQTALGGLGLCEMLSSKQCGGDGYMVIQW